MDDRYLWEKSGPPDPEVERLEKVLAPLAHDGRPLDLPAGAVAAGEAPRRAIPRARPGFPRWLSEPWAARLALAASIAAVAGAALWWSAHPTGPAWNVEWLDGAKRPGRLAVGQRIVTGAGERVRIEVADIGEVTLEPRSRLRLVRASAEERRLSLERGTLRALIVAPPRQFQVETPAATAVDLGCAYTLEVAADGRSVVTVETGWVSFERDGRETFVPAGARCVTKPGEDPGLPHYLDAAPGFVAALDRATAERAALDAALAAARPADALTLWHALARTGGDARAAVYDRLATLVPPPRGVTREGVLRADRAMLDLWWNEFGLGDVEWWRLWAQDPPARRG